MLTWWVTSTRLPFAGRSEARARTSRVRSASSVRSRKNEWSAPGLGGAEGQARGLEAPAPLARQHAPDRDAARGERGAHAARLGAALLGEVALGGAIAQAEARRVAERAVGRGVAHDDDLAAGAQEIPERLVGDGGARRQERQGREREDRYRAAHAAAQTVRTIFPNCLPSARRRWAAAPSLSGTISSTIALRRPAKNRRITSLNSRRFAMVEPMMWICFQKTIRMSVSAIGPVVAPHVTSRPPFRSDRSDCFHVWAPTFSRTTSTPRLAVFS